MCVAILKTLVLVLDSKTPTGGVKIGMLIPNRDNIPIIRTDVSLTLD